MAVAWLKEKGLPTAEKTKIISLLWLGLALSGCISTPTLELTERAIPPTLPPLEVGRQVFVEVCAECHGENGEGYANELAAPALDASEHAWHHPDQQICEWIVNGKLGIGREMPALGDQLAPEEIAAVITYLHTLWTPEQLDTQQDVTSRWPETPLPACGF